MAHGRYTIVGKIADGGMAEIFLATLRGAEGFEKPVVLKRVLTAFSADPQFRNMFIDEAHISMTLSHSNIVQVLDVGLSGERTFLVLELVEGWDLEDILARAQATGPDHPWPPSLGLYVTAQICRGLAYAHGKRAPDGRPLGIVHRDVNPTNVLISEQGEVKLADFGIAKAERKREQTAAGVIKGKIGFMSPEQATGRGLDARSDLFSVGTMLYLMLTGRRPFDAPSELDSMMRSQRAEYRPPEELNPYLPAEATAIVNRAMRRDPAGRYQTADEMLVDVERALRAHYNSAGQTELKVWLADLARRDGVLPMGRRLATSGALAASGPGSASDLSAGVSVELSDVGVGDAEQTLISTASPFELDPELGPRVPALPPPSSGATPGLGVGGRTPRPVPSGPGGPINLPGLVRGPGAGTPSPVTVRPGGGPASGRTPEPPTLTPSLTPSPTLSPTPSPSLTPPPTVGTPPFGGVAAPMYTLPQLTPAPMAAPPAFPQRMRRKSRIGFGFILGALCMLAAVFGIRWLAAWAGREGIVIPHVIGGARDGRANVDAGSGSPRLAEGQPSSPVAAAGREPEPPGQVAVPAGSGAPAPGGMTSDGSAGPPVPAAGTEPRATGPAAAAAAVAAVGPAADTTDASAPIAAHPPERDAAATPSAPKDESRTADDHTPVTANEEDEEKLLGQVVPDAATIIGEDEADPPPPPAPRKDARPPGTAQPAQGGQAPSSSSGTSAAARRPAPPPAARPPAPPVVIRITSSPLGAVVRTKKQVLGRTPIAIRFNPGNTYQLTFVKAGYVTSSRMVAVASGKPKSISVPMKKAAAPPRRSGLFRGR